VTSERERAAELLARCAWAHDTNDAEGVVGCFSPSGVMRVWMRDQPEEVSETQGRAAIAAQTRVSMGRKRAPRRHFLGMPLIESLGAGEHQRLALRTYFQVLELHHGRAATLVATGTYFDVVDFTHGDPWLVERGIEMDAPAFPSEPD
jgi:hypothetical protein